MKPCRVTKSRAAKTLRMNNVAYVDGGIFTFKWPVMKDSFANALRIVTKSGKLLMVAMEDM